MQNITSNNEDYQRRCKCCGRRRRRRGELTIKENLDLMSLSLIVCSWCLTFCECEGQPFEIPIVQHVRRVGPDSIKVRTEG